MSKEFRLLLDAVAQRAEPLLRKLSEQQSDDEHRKSCTWCPLCAALSLARGERPELAAKAAEHLTGLLTVLRASMEPDPAPQPEPEPAPERPEPAPRVQKISVDRT